jgi:predicted MPP superfamily phosphohydrolase
MFWFWFHVINNLLMVALDAVWWVLALRLMKKGLWRFLVCLFLAAQMAALVSLICGLDWHQYTPAAVPVAVVTWHHISLALGLVVLLPLGIMRGGAWMLRRKARRSGDQRNLPVAAPENAKAVSRRKFLGACATLAPPLFTVGLTGVALAQLNQLRVRRFTLSVPALPKALDGITIAHVSDTHVGGFTSARVLREMVSSINDLRADLVVMTGDLINYELTDLSEGIALMKALEGRYGLWMVEGNHDLFDNGGEFERRVKAAGVPLLLDESVVTAVRGYPVQFLGLSWTGSAVGHDQQNDRVTAFQLEKAMKQRHPDAFPILLAHHPHAFDAAIKADLPLTLSGHTHGGFWMLDSQHGIGPAFFRYWSGLYTRGRSQMIVSNGVGNWATLPPIRINAPAEVVHITLRCA